MHRYHCTLVRLKLISNTTSTGRLNIQRGGSQHHILAKSEESKPVSHMVIWSRYLPLIKAVIASLAHDAEIKQLSFLEGTSPSLLKPDSPVHTTLTYSVRKIISEEYISYKGKGREKNPGQESRRSEYHIRLILENLVPCFYYCLIVILFIKIVHLV